MNATSEDAKKDSDNPWHALGAGDVLAAQGTGTDGLSEAEAAARLKRFGPNRLPQAKRRGALMRFLAQFHDVLIYVLLAAAVVTALLDHFIDAQVILAVVLVNAAIGFIQEGKAEKALEAILGMLAPKAHVIRNGRRETVPGADLVPGDLVLLEAGERVPADLRLTEARALRADEAVLTGESVPVEKQTAPVRETAVRGDQTDMAFSGTLVTHGQGQGVAVATGTHTAIGKISGMLESVTKLETPLTRQMGVFAKWLTVSILALAAFVFVFGYFVRGYAFDEIFMGVVGLTVAAIPEGLPAILTITLAIGVQSMAGRNAIVRRLPAIETLGSVSVICTDKTGTLTRNEMAVVTIVTQDARFDVGGVGYAPQGRISRAGQDPSDAEHTVIGQLARAALLCNDAKLNETGGRWTVEGDPMEGALVTFAGKAGFDEDTEERGTPRTDVIPFDAEHRYMATLNHSHAGEGFIFVKGAPERILEMCAKARPAGGDVAIDQDAWRAQVEEIAGAGQRVLAVAVKDTDATHTVLDFRDVESGLTLLGLLGLIDPPRKEAIAAIDECRDAGIGVKMITGDHAGTAAAIARQLHLENTETVLTGVELAALDGDALRRAATRTAVFARTSPEQKLRLVEALQADGAVVAMTGDGVNDAPALKRADVGVAMGRNGSEAAKEVSDVVLADDNFATIAAAVREGRCVYDNLKKAILFILPTNGGEALVMITAILFGMTMPITPVQILWVNMVTAVTLALALAFEPAEPDVMRRPPREPDEAILSGFLVWRVAFVSIVFLAALLFMFELVKRQGASLDEARTVVVNTLVVLEIFYLFNVRFLHGSSLTLRGVIGTPAVLIAVVTVVALQCVFTYAPFMQTVFSTEPVSPVQALQVIGAGIVVFLILEIEKQVWSRAGHQSTGRKHRGHSPERHDENHMTEAS